jgi:hypothetical protein
VSKDYAAAEKLNFLGLHYGRIPEKSRKITVTPNGKPSLVSKIYRESVGVRKTVAEEEYHFRVGMERYRARH